MSKQMIILKGTLHIFLETKKATTPCHLTAWGRVKGLLATINMLLFYTHKSQAPATLYHLKKKNPISVHVLRHLVTLEAFFLKQILKIS